MADAVEKDSEELAGGIVNAGPPIPPEDTPEAPSSTASDTQSAPDPKNTRVIPPNAKPANQDNGVNNSQFVPGDDGAPPNQTYDALRQMLTLKGSDPHLEEMLRTARLRPTNDGQGLLIDLPKNAHCIHCGKLKDGSEFIGMPHKKMVVDAHDATIMVGLAKARGWKAVNVTGSEKERDLLWIEAMRQGMPVANHRPDPNSAIVKQWLEEDAKNPKPSLTEAKEEDFHVKTMKMLQEKAAAADDKDVKTGLETILKKFQDGAILGTADLYKSLSEALGDKTDKDGVKKAVDLLNKADPKLGLALAETPAPVAQPAATTTTPAVKPDVAAPA